MNIDQRSRQTLVALTAIVLAGLLGYSGMFAGGFKTLDDHGMILNDPDIRDLSQLPQVFKKSYFGDGTYYRPLLKASYMIDYAAFGPVAFYFYITNLLVHLAAASLVFLLLRELYDKTAVALVAALLFAIHPVHWVAVSMITGRSSSIEAVFFIACVYFFVLFSKGKRRGLNYALSLACFALALFSRETSVMIPAVLACYLYHFPITSKHLKGFGALAAFVIVAGGYFFLRQVLGITKLFVPRTMPEAAMEFMTFLRALITHLRLFILPFDLHFDRTRAVFDRFFDPELLLTVAFWVAVGAVLFIIGRRLSPRSRFLLWWVALTFFPVSQIPARILIQPGVITTGEHHLYLPSVGILALLSAAAFRFYERGSVAKSILKFAALGLILCLVSITMKQVKVTSDEVALHQQALVHEPDNFRLHNSYMAALVRHGRFRELEGEYRRMITVDDQNVSARIGLGKSLIDQGRVHEGMAEYEKIQHAGAYEALLRENLRLARQLLGENLR